MHFLLGAIKKEASLRPILQSVLENSKSWT